MLCFLPSRNVSEAVRDAFYWFTLNGRAFRLMFTAITVISALIAIFFYDNAPIKLLHANTKDLFNLIRPYSYATPEADDTNIIFGYCLLTFVSTILIVPLLHRYFKTRRSLAKLTYTKYYSVIREYLVHALICASIWTAVCYGVIVTYWLVGIVIVFLGSILASMDFCDWRFKKIKYYSFYIRSVLVAMILFCLIQGAPLLCSELLGIVLFFLDDLLPNALSTDSISNIVDMIAAFVVCISYCLAVVFFNTAITLIYGSSVDIE